ncbi:NUDIX hydrolase [Deinococcus piscis]|uniref:NUDIX hydrolase n=1 Tax=Deinococcus piscis TaxID=394230 RepID=UPI0016731889|nr:NUDIX domain-containing protein [Deinococcus piscis]
MPSSSTDFRFTAPNGVLLQVRASLLCLRGAQLLTCWDTRFPDFYSLPGGAVLTGEPAQAAAVREWKEETGQTIGAPRLCGLVENFFVLGGRECHELSFCFRVELAGPLPSHALDNAAVEFRWVPLAELPTILLYPVCVPDLLNVPAGQIAHFVSDTRA